MAGPTLLIGGMGFIGLHTARRFLDAGQDVVLTYHQHRREPDFLAADVGARAQVEQLDVLDSARVTDVIQRHGVEGVVYLVVPSLQGVSPADEFQTNTQGYLNVLEASRATGVRRLTVTSSVAIYSNVAERPWHEDAAVSTVSTNPTEAYKKALEVLGLYFGRRTGLDVVMLRIAGIFGPCTTRCPISPAASSTRPHTPGRPTSVACAPAHRRQVTVATCVTSRTARSASSSCMPRRRCATASTTSAAAKRHATQTSSARFARSSPSSTPSCYPAVTPTTATWTSAASRPSLATSPSSVSSAVWPSTSTGSAPTRSNQLSQYPTRRGPGSHGCARRTSSSISAPQPGPVGTRMHPSVIVGGIVTRSRFQGTSSMSISMIRTFGSTAQRWIACRSARWL